MEYTLKAKGLHVLELIKRPERENEGWLVRRWKLKERIKGDERKGKKGEKHKHESKRIKQRKKAAGGRDR